MVANYWRTQNEDGEISNRSSNSVARLLEKVIHSSPATRWLKWMGFKYKEYRKSIYNDGHERADMKRYRDQVFLPRMATYASQFMMWDDNLNIIPNPKHESGEVQPIILVTQDESTFNANDGPHFIWVHNQHKPLRKTGRCQGLHISEFLIPIGLLRNGKAMVSLKCSGDVWWNGERLLEQVVSKAIPAFEAQLPGCKALFAFDNARNHLKCASDVLRVPEINLEPGGKKTNAMRDTFVIDDHHPDEGYTQYTVFPDGTPKGLKAVLIECSLWPQTVSRFLAQCTIKSASGKGMKPNPQCLLGGNRCACALLAAQLDFQQQKSQIEDAILAAGHDVIFYPAFHCELNFIEYY